jgi:regulator of replication initiation timing
MNNDTVVELYKENTALKLENEELKIQLQKYTSSQKNYYHKNKDIINARAKERLKKLSETNPDKIKEYRKTAYLNRKEKAINEII